jgi:hypothetical protein
MVTDKYFTFHKNQLDKMHMLSELVFESAYWDTKSPSLRFYYRNSLV